MSALVVALTAPSGAGKTTIARRILQAFPDMRFSVSATTRPPRPHEQSGRDYHFLTEEAFRERIAAGAFLEFEEVYPGRFYGTLRAEIEGPAADHPILLDIDVKGALRVKELYADRALTVFIRPPSLAVLAQRLRDRATETEQTLVIRLERAQTELAYAEQFDAVVLNDDLETASQETIHHIRTFLGRFEAENVKRNA